MTTLALFTVFLDFRGGFYIRQVRAAEEIEALRAWAAAFAEQKPIPRVSHIIARNALKDLEVIDDYFGMRLPPTPIDTVTDVWCSSAKCGRDMAVIYIVRTAEPL
jgi:hypothetical protein